MNTLLQEGKKYTLITLTWMAVTHRAEVTILGSESHLGLHFCKEKGKRKAYALRRKDLDQALVFKGHQLPLVIDRDTNKIWGNAQLNFVTEDPDALRTYIREQCVNPSDLTFGKILYHHPDGTGKEGGDPLFPEVA